MDDAEQRFEEESINATQPFPNPTPNPKASTPRTPEKLTAEEFTRHVVVAANPCCLDEQIEFVAGRKNVLPLVVRRDDLVRRKAFEEAAEMRPEKEPHQYREGHAYNVGWEDAVKAYSAAVREFAKEKPDG